MTAPERYGPPARPACFCADDPPPRACGPAATPDTWAALTEVSPGCAGCTKAKRAQDIYWGLVS